MSQQISTHLLKMYPRNPVLYLVICISLPGWTHCRVKCGKILLFHLKICNSLATITQCKFHLNQHDPSHLDMIFSLVCGALRSSHSGAFPSINIWPWIVVEFYNSENEHLSDLTLMISALPHKNQNWLNMSIMLSASR